MEDAIGSMEDEILGVEVECSVSLQNFAGASVPVEREKKKSYTLEGTQLVASGPSLLSKA